MPRVTFSLLPTSMREWLGGAVGEIAIVAVGAVVALSPTFRGVVAFWFAWSGLALSVVLHLVRRFVLILRGRSELATRWDTLLLGAIQVLALAAFVTLYFRL